MSAIQQVLASYGATALTYATWNPSDKSAGITLSGGNLVATGNTGGWHSVRATIGKSSGKWYWEVTYITNGGSSYCIIGLMNSSASLATHPGGDTNGYGYYASNGNKYVLAVSSAYGATFATGDVIGLALDMNAGTLIMYKNNVSQGTLASSISGTFYPGVGMSSSDSVSANFGATTMTYTAPSGYNQGLYS